MPIWKNIPGLPTYEANASGEIRRVREGFAPRVLVPSLKEDGYWRVAVWIGGSRQWRAVHRIICLTFHGEPPHPDAMACHRDGDRGNNSKKNVYWGTAKQNYDDAVRHGTAHIMPLQTPEDVLKEWFNRDRVLNRNALSAYERGKFGGVKTSKQRTALRKEAISRGYTTDAS